jgi:signal transduction histidine kinase
MSALRLAFFGTDAAFSAALRDVLAAQLPETMPETLDPAQLKSRPMADGIIIDARADASAGATLASRLRAMGFAGGVVVVSDGSAEHTLALLTAGAGHAAPNELATKLVAVLSDQLASAGSPHAAQVMRARRLIAAGEIALRFQHSLNNPLAGILAEAQLMQLESLPPEQHAALERIVGLCRRIIDLGRSLDGMGDRKS